MVDLLNMINHGKSSSLYISPVIPAGKRISSVKDDNKPNTLCGLDSENPCRNDMVNNDEKLITENCCGVITKSGV